MDNPTAAMIAIGDEILSGRTRDANIHNLAKCLSGHGIDLCEVRIVSDCREHIINTVNELRTKVTHLFTCGGIGPTHDDITAESIAAAFNVNINVHQDARRLIAERCIKYGVELNASRLRMARIPEGAVLIKNRVSAAPGFSIENVHVMAGVPDIFMAMLDDLLSRIPSGLPLAKKTIEIDSQEGDLAAKLSIIADQFPNVQIGSYPFRKRNRFGVNVVVRGKCQDQVDTTAHKIQKTFGEMVIQ